ncbi:PTST-like protein 2 [Cardamine amara subsp. amara]|uniref:PTST-like protein 2 n=1 Tax=Cardamine amara subsp. amara TaxID=228776 RepID=A0ABD0ZNM4_CARAN
MVSLNSGPISSFVSRNSMIDSDTLLSLSSFSTFNPNYSAKTCIRFALAARNGCGPCGSVLRFLVVKPSKKGCCFRCSGVLRMCNKRNLGWDSDGSKDLETEILEFMKNSENPGMFPSKKDLIRSGRFDLVERIVNQGGWLSMGWDLDEQEEVKVNENVMPQDLHIEKQLHYCNPQVIDGTLSHGAFDLSSNPSSSREEVDGGSESGIEGILTRLEKERNLSLGISLREKGESNGPLNDISTNGSIPWTSVIVTASEIREIDGSRSSGEYAKSTYQETKPVSGTGGLSDPPTSDTWRTWSMRRAGFTDENFEAAEISTSCLNGVKKDNNTNKDSGGSMNGKDRTASSMEDTNKTHIKSRLQHLQSELSSVLHSLRSPPDEVVTSKDSEINSGHLENIYDDWEYKENEIIHAQDKLRSTRAKLTVLEGKMAMAIIDAQRIVREKQRRIDHARRALRLLRTASIVWPNSASEVLLTGSFDGWSMQRKMKKAQNGVFSLSLKLYPGKYEIKFIVDGQWKVDPLRPIVTCGGYENNLLIIS